MWKSCANDPSWSPVSKINVLHSLVRLQKLDTYWEWKSSTINHPKTFQTLLKNVKGTFWTPEHLCVPYCPPRVNFNLSFVQVFTGQWETVGIPMHRGRTARSGEHSVKLSCWVPLGNFACRTHTSRWWGEPWIAHQLFRESRRGSRTVQNHCLFWPNNSRTSRVHLVQWHACESRVRRSGLRSQPCFKWKWIWEFPLTISANKHNSSNLLAQESVRWSELERRVAICVLDRITDPGSFTLLTSRDVNSACEKHADLYQCRISKGFHGS